ncbi:MAG: hypothetical protein WD069_01895 [Planctomycetales bacterium]
MTFDWQTITAVACVAAAALFLGRRALRLFAGRGGCGTGGCGTCPSKTATGDDSRLQKPFVALDALEGRPRDGRKAGR